jgi:enediyne polyketide synthase
LREKGWSEAEIAGFLDGLESRYKVPFPEINEDSLAGRLANTIATGICSYFDLRGGGYTVDAAGASSLLSVATACNALANGDLQVAIAGGVDLSLDPFELFGPAQGRALAMSEMRVYDRNSNGFWPGEGCGMLVLMRDADAIGHGLRRHAVIAGWGHSSDGKSGNSLRLALCRAYERAGFGIDTVSYLEGNGTGTAVDDAAELRALTGALLSAGVIRPVSISTVKANLGHTRAAAGVAGLLKAILAVREQVIPPATGHVDRHPALEESETALRIPASPELWPDDRPVRAGVTSMGLGGTNAHVVLESVREQRRSSLSKTTTAMARSRQNAELLLLDARTTAELVELLDELAEWTTRLSFAEISDLAVGLAGDLAERPLRAAVVASSPLEASRRLRRLAELVAGGTERILDVKGGIFLGSAGQAPRIGLLFPGQGVGRRGDGGALRRRFPEVDELYRRYQPPVGADLVAPEVAQPRIVTASVAGLRILARLGIEATGATGYSLGELTALHWAGAMDEAQLLATAAARGRMMAEASDGNGAMAVVAAPPATVETLLVGTKVVIAGYDGPKRAVISGPAAAVERITKRHGVYSFRIAVSHAFHSTAVAAAAVAFADYLRGQSFAPQIRPIFSTVDGGLLRLDTDLADLLHRQVLEPVRFDKAVAQLAAQSDLLLEVGPGRNLLGLVAEIAPGTPAISLETDGQSLTGLLAAAGAAYAMGTPLDYATLFEDRFTRPLQPGRTLRFFASPAEPEPASLQPKGTR